MKKNLTEIIICLDRSGSMSSIKTDMELGLKTFLDKQKLEPGECMVTLVQFDSEIETVFENKNIQDINNIDIHPRGMTALLDGIGTAVTIVGSRLSKTSEDNRPEFVFCIILSDGAENSSKEFNNQKIKEMIKHQEDKYSWKFIYLGANQDAFSTGRGYGICGGSSISYNASSSGVHNSMHILSSGISCMRASTVSSKDFSFSDSERKSAMTK
jgi:uncharacterized protein YegL